MVTLPDISTRSTFAVLAGFALVAGPALYGGGEFDSNGRGDNPVVGSLPCVVDLRLDDLFWLPNGLPAPPPGALVGVPPIIGFTGTKEMAGVLLGAQGEPYGIVDDFEQWSTLGLVNQASVTLDRGAASRDEVSMWQYLPAGYLGGTLTFNLSGSITSQAIVSQLNPIQLREVAMLPGVVGAASMTFEPPIGSRLDTIIVNMPFYQGAVNVQYLP